MDDLVERARSYATSAHARINHLRKYSLQPYDVHLNAVAKLVASVSDDHAMIAAAWLHDIVEDTPVTFDDLGSEFGIDIMTLVMELTDISKPGDGNRITRKELDRRHLAGGSPRAKTIKLADVIDNCEDICRHDPRFGRVYLAEMQSLLEVLTEGDERLHAKAVKLVSQCAGKLGIVLSPPSAADIKSTASIAAKHVFSGQHGMRLFTGAFSARDIQEPLLSFDEQSLQKGCYNTEDHPHAPLWGVRSNGNVAGYLTREELSSGGLLNIRRFDRQQMAGLETSLTDVIHILTHFTFCFVELDGMIVGVISRQDIEKPVVRMWLFGIIIMIEVQVVEMIRSRCPNESWIERVSAGRVEKARQLQAERLRRGLNADLLDCLQFSDKLQIALQEQDFIETAEFSSKSGAKKTIKDLESLRNNLAHGQDITSRDWPPIVRLARRVQQFVGT